MSIPASLADHLQLAARKTPTSLALHYGEQTWSFAEWLAEIRLLASTLPPRDSPLMWSGNSLELARHAGACSIRNLAFFPIDRSSSLQKTSFELDRTRHDVALIISTSGSEGKPRAVLLGKAQLDAAAAASNLLLPLGPGDLWLNCLPLYHIGGQSILWRCASAGAAVRLHDGFDAASVAGDLASQPVSHISLVPAMLARLLDLGIRPPPTLRVTLIGGAALSRPLYERATAAGWPLYPSYGMSETAAQCATFDPADGPWHEGLVGRPMPGHEIRVGDDGRIRIRGPQVMLGYLDGSGLDGDGWLLTGDLGTIDANGNLTVLGRADDMLISGGRNVHPQEIESCLAACPGVEDIAVTGLPDPVWGDLIVALVVGPVAPENLLAHARAHLPSAALPRQIRHLAHLPRNATGKLERAALRRLAAELRP
ncbi:class I adenylate-forming enzyme family protein [Ferribacterium limneticum]|uniref:class I adenylate-forming enzyme family protein n=1 Tax=Ferribacterium limneticum TaxID=76259 RepID=UPI001CFB498F|nr:AMP-binding protein [Ferribacterium limneticum]UCV29844.1 AMP-binding protein [Ferribacterium limneticum]UCV33763.1 AMP-binding protein [Ferribacterium limneticum]